MHLPSARTLAAASTLLAARTLCSQPAEPAPSPLPGLTYDANFFPESRHDPAIPTPGSVLGARLGDRPATHAQVEAVLRAIDAASDRVEVVEYGRTHEGRALYYAVVASPENLRRQEELRRGLATLADPRTASAGEVDRLAGSLPLVAWMAYCIHGDENSGTDAALALLHHLAACVDGPDAALLDDLVVIIDPLMNPDGRDRWLAGQAENRTAQPSVDDQSMLHAGGWSAGRTNHYLFDLNRDWIFGTQPETRGRIEAVRRWNPHFFLESHEMGSQDTFLFFPPREPININEPAHARRWWSAIASDHAAAFDAQGWRYYTGEWNEDWYPGYSCAWAGLRGAIGQLYEQANISTDAVRRADGSLEPYRLAVHKQLESSLANLRTLRAHRAEILGDYVAGRRECLAPDGRYARRVFAVPPIADPARRAALLDAISLQGFEAAEARAEFKASGRDGLGRDVQDRAFPPGTILIPNRQPEGRLLAALFEFDPRMSDEFLASERRELLGARRSRLYDTTAWNLTMLMGIEAFELAMDALPESGPVPAHADGGIVGSPARLGFAIDGADDRSLAVAARLMEQGVRVRALSKPTRWGGVELARGSILVLRGDNPGQDLPAILTPVAQALGVVARGLETGLGPDDLPDIGGEHAVLLELPRVALVGQSPFDSYTYGEAWHLIDRVLGMRASYINADHFDGVDLRRYNVLIIPDGGEGWVAGRAVRLRPWVEEGGTLIAIGSSAAALATDAGLGGTRTLPDGLPKRDEHLVAVIREWDGRESADVDLSRVWDNGLAQFRYPWVPEGEQQPAPDADEAKRRDEWRAIFSPQGAVVAGRIDRRSWLTFGSEEPLPILYRGGVVLWALGGAEAPVRLGFPVPIPPPLEPGPNMVGGWPTWKLSDIPVPQNHRLLIRMSGLLWPEASSRIANAAFVTCESVGRGQVILFACSPTTRAATLGTQRLLANAIVLGPGMGASQPIKP